MNSRSSRSFPGVLFIVYALASQWALPAGASDYPETEAVFLEVYEGEVQALTAYRAYAAMAVNESYPNIAYLFTSLASSESIHARNVRALLEELGVEEFGEPAPVKVQRTRKNLKKAAQVELREIDRLYPAYIRRISAENYPGAVTVLTQSWKAEQQHREHIEKIKLSVNSFFKSVAEKIESSLLAYYICESCGSTVAEPPEHNCGICGGPAAGVHLVPVSAPAQ